MSEIKLPRIYLIKRSAVRDEAVQHALDITPVCAVLAPSSDALNDAEHMGDTHTLLNGAPIAIVADFEHPLSAINEDGSVTIVCPAQESK